MFPCTPPKPLLNIDLEQLKVHVIGNWWVHPLPTYSPNMVILGPIGTDTGVVAPPTQRARFISLVDGHGLNRFLEFYQP